jgi:hypothetical protein
MAKKNKICFLCGQPYYYCPTCNTDDRLKPSWYNMFDSDICKELDGIISRYTAKKISVKEAQGEILKLDLSKINIIDDSINKVIKEILSYKDKEEIEKKVDTKKEK